MSQPGKTKFLTYFLRTTNLTYKKSKFFPVFQNQNATFFHIEKQTGMAINLNSPYTSIKNVN